MSEQQQIAAEAGDSQISTVDTNDLQELFNDVGKEFEEMVQKSEIFVSDRNLLQQLMIIFGASSENGEDKQKISNLGENDHDGDKVAVSEKVTAMDDKTRHNMKIHAFVEKLENVLFKVRMLKIFSENEEVIDINSEDLRFLFVLFFISQMYNNFKISYAADPTTRSDNQHLIFRINNLKSSIKYLLAFLDLLEELKFFSSEVDKIFKKFKALLDKINLNAGMDDFNDQENAFPDLRMLFDRDTKISFSTKLKHLDLRLKGGNLMKTGGTEDMREFILLLLEKCVFISFQDLLSHSSEINLLEQQLKLLTAQGQGRQSAESAIKAPTKNPANEEFPRKNFVIQSVKDRVQITSEIFRPSWSQPTMTLEEFSQLEMEKLRLREAQKEAAKDEADENDRKKTKDILAEGREDETEAWDKAVERDRAWDDYKDENPKGSGVTKRF